MDTATRINQLLGRLDSAATILTDTQHPDVVVRLDVNAAADGMAGILECAITEARATPGCYAVTLTPTRRHCRECGRIFDAPLEAPGVGCPYCTTQHPGAPRPAA